MSTTYPAPSWPATSTQRKRLRWIEALAQFSKRDWSKNRVIGMKSATLLALVDKGLLESRCSDLRLLIHARYTQWPYEYLLTEEGARELCKLRKEASCQP